LELEHPTGGHVMVHTHAPIECTLGVERRGRGVAKIIDLPYLPGNKAAFRITEKGVEDAEEE